MVMGLGAPNTSIEGAHDESVMMKLVVCRAVRSLIRQVRATLCWQTDKVVGVHLLGGGASETIQVRQICFLTTDLFVNVAFRQLEWR